jgi:NADPH-dependent curcumin reductase CurA
MSSWLDMPHSLPGPPGAGAGEVLCRSLYLSLDPANRAWMQGATYRAALEPGQVMAGATGSVAGQIAKLNGARVVDNVGGPTIEGVLFRMNLHGRIVCCGVVSQYDTDAPTGTCRTGSTTASWKWRKTSLMAWRTHPPVWWACSPGRTSASV